MSNDDVKNKLKTLTQGQKSDRVIEQMAMTFRPLCIIIYKFICLKQLIWQYMMLFFKV